MFLETIAAQVFSQTLTKKTPPYSGKNLGTDPTKPPAKGFEWKGKGKPGSKEGNWYHPEKKISIRHDLDHPPPVKPHWDCHVSSPKSGYRLFEDGTWENKD